ncbi:OmpA family protein [Flavobacterium sp.]|uniref:OmpA family protein n=1 Tax=Flavobacterium sp. TaxID=239 RepID=UPI00262C12B3|nr:OmpA family protein [Flavobacterium sp.]
MTKILRFAVLLVSFQWVSAQEQFVVYFDNNKFDLNKTEQAKLDKWILENKTSKILSITGSTDEVGSSGFNDTLSLKRVNSIYAKVNGKLKIREDFKTISLGEKGATSTIKAENRKAIIHYILEKDLARENEILGIKPKVVVEEETVPIEEEAMNFPEGATLLDKINLSTKGTLIRLEDINFHVNTFAIIPSSKRAIDELILVMNKFPKLKIEIQGHICCVQKDARNLSLDRAKQVRRILISEGIADARVKVKGFGVSKPKFAIPEKSEFEAARNRRVEIMVLDK